MTLERTERRATIPEQAPAPGDGILPLMVSLLQRRALLFGLPVAFFGLVATVTLLSTRTYTASASFTPQTGSSQAGQLASLAAQFGVPMGSGQGASADFYVALLRTGEVLRAVVRHRYRLPDEDATGTLLNVYQIDSMLPDGRRVFEAVKRLRGNLQARTDPRTSVVHLSVRAESPDLARQIVLQFLEEVNRFDQQTRQTQAGQERRFIEGRLHEAQDSLRVAEGDLGEFLEHNRQFRNSPPLAFEHDRLQRVVSMAGQVVVSLLQAYERARIDEVRNTPVVSILEPPILPPLPDRRLLVVKSVVAIVVGFIVAVLIVLLTRFGVALRIEDPDSADQFRRTVAGLFNDLRRPWRLVRPASDGDEARP